MLLTARAVPLTAAPATTAVVDTTAPATVAVVRTTAQPETSIASTTITGMVRIGRPPRRPTIVLRQGPKRHKRGHQNVIAMNGGTLV